MCFFSAFYTERKSSVRLTGCLVLMRNVQVIDAKRSGLHRDENSLDGFSSPLSAASPSVCVYFFFLCLSISATHSSTTPLPTPHPLRFQEPFSISKQNNLLCGFKAFQLREAFISDIKTFSGLLGIVFPKISFALCAFSCCVPQ